MSPFVGRTIAADLRPRPSKVRYLYLDKDQLLQDPFSAHETGYSSPVINELAKPAQFVFWRLMIRGVFSTKGNKIFLKTLPVIRKKYNI